MKKYIKHILLFFATILILSKASSQTLPQCTTSAIPFNNTDLCKIYGAILTTSTSGGGSVTITDTLNVKNNNLDTTNNNLKRISNSLYSFPDGFSNADLNKLTSDRLLDPNTGSSQAELSYQILNTNQSINNTLTSGTLNVQSVNVSSVSVTNTNLATVAQQTLQTTYLASIYGATSKPLGVEFAIFYNVEVFEDSDLATLQSSIQSWISGLGTERILSLQYSSYAYWNGVTAITKYSAIIIFAF